MDTRDWLIVVQGALLFSFAWHLYCREKHIAHLTSVSLRHSDQLASLAETLSTHAITSIKDAHETAMRETRQMVADVLQRCLDDSDDLHEDN